MTRATTRVARKSGVTALSMNRDVVVIVSVLRCRRRPTNNARTGSDPVSYLATAAASANCWMRRWVYCT